MNRKTSTRISASCLTAVALLLIRSNCSALPVDLGSAGYGSWSVFETGSGTVSISGAAPAKARSGRRTASVSTATQNSVVGNVGTAGAGHIMATGATFSGDLYLGNNSAAQFSGSYSDNRPVSGTVHLGDGATVSPNYSFNNISDGPQGLLSQARADAIAASAAASALTPSSNLTQINLKKQNVTLDSGVYNLSSLNLNKSTLTLSGSGSFVFNISSAFALKQASILLAGGATEANVLFNYTGTQDVTLSGSRKSGSVLHGIILALNSKVNLAAGLVVGEVISGQDIAIGTNSAVVQQALSIATVPDRGSTLILAFVAFAALAAFQTRLGRRAVAARS
jgi:hypothetical protein